MVSGTEGAGPRSGCPADPDFKRAARFASWGGVIWRSPVPREHTLCPSTGGTTGSVSPMGWLCRSGRWASWLSWSPRSAPALRGVLHASIPNGGKMRDAQGPPVLANPTTAPPPDEPGRPTEQVGLTRPRYLVIVSREELDLWHHVAQYNRDLKGVQVLVDRRQRERRQQDQPVALDRRRVDRRRPPTVGGGSAPPAVPARDPRVGTRGACCPLTTLGLTGGPAFTSQIAAMTRSTPRRGEPRSREQHPGIVGPSGPSWVCGGDAGSTPSQGSLPRPA